MFMDKLLSIMTEYGEAAVFTGSHTNINAKTRANMDDHIPAFEEPFLREGTQCLLRKVANDFNALHKADRRYGDLLARSVEMIFRMVNHANQDVRTYAEESLDAVLREVVVPSIELLDKIMADPLPWLWEFIPLKFDLAAAFRPKVASVADMVSRTAFPVFGEVSLPSSSLRSMLDVSETGTGICDVNTPLLLPERSAGPSSSSRSSFPTVEDEVIDPLHADLYEEDRSVNFESDPARLD
ncbi:unnamed protein product [Cylicocyclus nassatus]|uniref:Uncharacterized protein n=1 Tax=Cylicocyclus nassatus TaxID=53992 RepID=A0AA36H4P8_CYLNA|nr:unnamed protein product [Cylicocyclus nassatus]